LAADSQKITRDEGRARAAARQWLTTSFGQALLNQEARLVEEAFDGLFGEQCLQLGLWGEPNMFLRSPAGGQ
jgi:hypothetical protein